MNTMAQKSDYLKMIECAVKAPSGHNTQPWKFRMGENKIEIIPDYTKTLPVVDGDNRELFISLGCAAENLCIAASTFGYTSDMSIKEDTIISIYLNKSEKIIPDEVYYQIEKRQTNRSEYNGKIIQDTVLSQCIASLPKSDNMSIHSWQNGTVAFIRIKELVREGNVIQMQDKAFLEELKSWMRFNRKHSDEKKDGLSYAVFGAPNLPAFISKPIIGSFLNSKKQNKEDMKKIDFSSHFVLFTTSEDRPADWINLGRQLERFLLLLTQAGISHAYTNQPCEVYELREKLIESFDLHNEIPQILIRIGYTTPAPYSKRRNTEEVIVK